MGKGNFNSSRRLGRILAFQGLYSWDVGGISKEDVLSLSWAQEDDVEDGQGEDSKEPVSMETAVFARVLIDGAINNQEKIDSLISGHLSGWEFNRVNKVSMAILRMSVYSLLFQLFLFSRYLMCFCLPLCCKFLKLSISSLFKILFIKNF